ncbi:hypothetical protein [Streptomyces sp. NPDC004783]|uniref:hypothetical protein n=1 Tax=Streptomyces sp. NPDC004783 TaxID=3154459 RepID=UPI00339EB865
MIAERHRAAILHDDGDFDMIASVSGLRAEWSWSPGPLTEADADHVEGRRA